jgi:outer membrane protein TolC
MNKMSLQDQKTIINNLLFEASNAYWEWMKSHQVAENIQQIVEISENRFQLIKKSFLLGERPAIDTLEAYTQVQFYQNYVQNAQLNIQKNQILLSSYLWNDQGQNVILNDKIVPDNEIANQKAWGQFDINLNSMLARAEELHPEIKSYDFKLNALKIEKQLKFQNLLPKINFDYQQLSPGNQFANMFNENSFSKNYIAGLKIELPIPLRFGRAEYEKAKIKLQDEQLNQNIKRNSIQVKIKQYHAEFENLKRQLKIQQDLIENYKKLSQSEDIRLQNGEGSLFLVNSRELKTLESIEKMLETRAKFYKSMYATQWAAGLLAEDLIL